LYGGLVGRRVVHWLLNDWLLLLRLVDGRRGRLVDRGLRLRLVSRSLGLRLVNRCLGLLLRLTDTKILHLLG
jgi:hypothetical protein